MKKTWKALLVIGMCACGACKDLPPLSPIGPSDSGGFAPGLTQDVARQWSPYVVVQPDDTAMEAYRDTLLALRRNNLLQGVRIEITKRTQNPTDSVTKAIGALGIEILSLIGNEYLFEEDIEDEIDRIFAAYPEVRYFQIGNEVTTILPSTGPTITIEQYMQVFQRIYDHVQDRHPGRAILLTQSTLGSGLLGPSELETMADLGVAQMNPDRVILAINAYDPDAVSQYRGVLGGKLRSFRVWVTESGVPDPTLHIPFVQEKYPLLRDYLRAERVYWYVTWGGDTGSDTNYGLIRNPTSYPNHWTSPLLDLLTRRP